MRRLSTLLALSAIAFQLASATPPPQAACNVDLDQGWTRQQSEEFWFTSQGSRLMPYSWFMALEVADPNSQVLLRDNANMDRYGYIVVPPSPRNPDGLPIGFAKDVGSSGDEHVGLTCAACHTGSLSIAGKRVIVEGGPALADFWMFFGEAVAALNAAQSVPSKFERFSRKVLHNNSPSTAELETLRSQMKKKLDDLETRLRQNLPTNPHGYGRVDAFGHIFTRVLAQNLGIADNARPPYAPAVQAPVSYPFLWDTPQLDVVQWNGSAPNSRLLSLGPLGRNVGEVLGVFGELQIIPGRQIPFLPFLNTPAKFISSAQLSNLMRLESMVRSLSSPVWPKNCLPLADSETLARGKQVYDRTCIRCHRLLTDPERKMENRQVTAVLKTLPEIHTDPTMAMNFVARRGQTGVLQSTPNIVKFERFGSEASGHEILLAAVNGVLLRGIDRPSGVPVNFAGLRVNLLEELAGFSRALEAARTPRYKARPLDGIWATAPYLHNGSVPTLWDLLSPPKDRPSMFYLRSREFDPQKIGLVTKDVPGAFHFDTSPQGNWNNGHEFGTSLPVQQKKDLLEFLKTL